MYNQIRSLFFDLDIDFNLEKKDFEGKRDSAAASLVRSESSLREIEDKIKAVKGKEINLFREDFFEKALKNSYTIADLENHLNKKLK